MKILLIRPPVPDYTIGLKNIMLCEPLELEYVAAGLYQHEVRIFDMILEKNLLKRLNRFKPDVIGTSCYITGVNEVIKICRKVKEWNQTCLTVVGGVHASVVPEDFLDRSIDCIVLGDGTMKMQEIVEAFSNSEPFDNIKGLAIPQSDNKLKYTGSCDYMIKPDQLPFPRRDLLTHLKHKYYYLFHQPVTMMKTTWGCWYNCNFCFNWKVTGGIPYSRTPESIIAELKTIDTKEVYIVDDIFLINPKRLLAIASLIKENNIQKNYLVYSRADFICEHEEIIEVWAGIGLTAVIIGLEASTDPELDSMNKQCTVDYNRKAVEILRKNKVDTYGSLIPNPDYTPEDWKRLQKFIDDLGLYYINVSPLTPMPGTDLWNKYKDKIIVSRKAHALWDLSHTVLKTKMPLKDFYRSLLKVYTSTVLNISRANKLTLRTRPPVYSYKYLRLWSGAFKIMFQFLNAHNHHINNEQGSLRMIRFNSIRNIDKSRWDSINKNIFNSYDFLLSIENSNIEAGKLYYLLFFYGEELIGSAVLSSFYISLDLLAGDFIQKGIKKIRKYFPAFFKIKFLFCGTPISIGKNNLTLKDSIHKDEFLRLLSREMSAIAKAEGITLQSVKELQDDEASEFSGFKNFNFVLANSIPYMKLNIRWENFESYIKEMRYGYRRQIKDGLHKIGLKKPVIYTNGFSKPNQPYFLLSGTSDISSKKFYSLYLQVMLRAKNKLETLNASFFENFFEIMKDNLEILSLKHGEEILGSAILAREGNKMTFILVGFDHEAPEKYDIYFNLIYGIIYLAIERGCTVLDMGQTSNYTKQRLGALPTNTFFYIKSDNKLIHLLLKKFRNIIFPEVVLSSYNVFKTMEMS